MQDLTCWIAWIIILCFVGVAFYFYWKEGSDLKAKEDASIRSLDRCIEKMRENHLYATADAVEELADLEFLPPAPPLHFIDEMICLEQVRLGRSNSCICE